MYTIQYMVQAIADPATIARVLNPLTQRGIVPDHVEIDSCGERMTIHINVAELDENISRLIAQKIESLFLVEGLSWQRDGATSIVSMVA